MANNKWAYVFPKDDQWEYVRCINLNISTDNEANSTGGSMYAGTKGRLHPSGKFIYGADNGLSPSDIEKYDIQIKGKNVKKLKMWFLKFCEKPGTSTPWKVPQFVDVDVLVVLFL